VRFDEDADFLKPLLNQMENFPITSHAGDGLVEQALRENYQVKNSLLEKEALLKELQWTKDADKLIINLSGGYTYPDSDWFVMIDFAVNLADGGAQELKVKQKEEDIKRKDINIDYLIEILKLEAEQLLDQDQYNQLVLQTQMMSLEKEQNKVKIMEQQYQQGAISLTQWENSLLVLKEKELSVKQSLDQWLVDRLKLAQFIGYLQKGV
jgi:outer membrane protein TolC